MATRPGGAAAKPIVVSATVRPETRPVLLERGALTVEVSLRPVSVTVRRAGAPVIERLGAWCADGLVADRFVQLTEGVIPRERLEAADPVQTGHVVDASGDGVVLGARTRSGRDAEVSVSVPASGEVIWTTGGAFTISSRHGTPSGMMPPDVIL